jgi:hypothetical protein
MVGLAVPRMRLVEFANSEWGLIKESLRKFVRRNKGNGQVGQVEQKLRSELDRPFILVMDLVRGQPLECNYQLQHLLCAPPSRDLFVQSFGFMLSLDILINNSDRVPLVHNNEGNASNILLTDQGLCVAIDTALTSIRPGGPSQKLLERHLQKVEDLFSLLSLLHDDLAGDSPSSEEERVRCEVISRLEPVRDFLWRATAHRISDELCLSIAREVLRGARRISTVFTAGQSGRDEEEESCRRRLRELKESVASSVTVDWERVWERSLELVNLEFLEEVLKVFQRHSQVEPEVR